MKASELTDLKQIDALAALAQSFHLVKGSELEWVELSNRKDYFFCPDKGKAPTWGHCRRLSDYNPSSGNAQTYELIEKFVIGNEGRSAWIWKNGVCIGHQGSTPAIAICKAVIASEWGDTIPDDVMEQVR